LSTRIKTIPDGVVAPFTVTVSATFVPEDTAQSALLVVSDVVVSAVPIVLPPPVGVALDQFVISIFTSSEPSPEARS
jgi:hypothetical protein